MTLALACGWSFVRSAAVALVGVHLSRRHCAVLRQTNSSRRTILWILLLAPYFAPELLIGHTYSGYTFSLVHHPIFNEFLYGLLVALKFVPAGVVVRYFSPPSPLTAEAIHCRRLSWPASIGTVERFKHLAGLWARGPGRTDLIVFAVVFLLVFQEFEMASLMGVTTGLRESPVSWTVAIFDAQVGGLPLVDSLLLAVRPLLCELLVLLPALCIVLTGREPASAVDRQGKLSFAGACFVWIHISVALFLLCAIPAFVVLRGALGGILGLAHNVTLWRAILAAGVVAIASGLTATVAAGVTVARARRSEGWFWLICAAVFSVPGLCGSLVVSLAIGAAFSGAVTAGVLDTGLPMVVAMVLFLLPRAVLLQLLLHVSRPAEATHEAALLAASAARDQRRAGLDLLWRLKFGGQFWGIVLLCYWAFWELTPSATLAPPGMLTAPVLLYNFMHYGQSAALSSLLIAAILAPVIAIVVAWAVRPPLLRWFSS